MKRQRKIQFLVIAVLAIILTGMSLAYASYTEQIEANMVVTGPKHSMDVAFETPAIVSKNPAGVETTLGAESYTISADGLGLGLDLQLTEEEQLITVNAPIINHGDIHARLMSVELSANPSVESLSEYASISLSVWSDSWTVNPKLASSSNYINKNFRDEASGMDTHIVILDQHNKNVDSSAGANISLSDRPLIIHGKQLQQSADYKNSNSSNYQPAKLQFVVKANKLPVATDLEFRLNIKLHLEAA